MFYIGDLIKRRNTHKNAKKRYFIKYNKRRFDVNCIMFIKFDRELNIIYNIEPENDFTIDN